MFGSRFGLLNFYLNAVYRRLDVQTDWGSILTKKYRVGKSFGVDVLTH
jgi:hypothetical protein